MNKDNPERVIEEAVKGMLPKNKLGRSMIKKLKVFRVSEHNHESQKPIEWNPNLWAKKSITQQEEEKLHQLEYI